MLQQVIASRSMVVWLGDELPTQARFATGTTLVVGSSHSHGCIFPTLGRTGELMDPGCTQFISIFPMETKHCRC
jgi:hypothetical protein